MMSPRTASLREQNRELLKQLEHNVSLLKKGHSKPFELRSNRTNDEEAENESRQDAIYSCPVENFSDLDCQNEPHLGEGYDRDAIHESSVNHKNQVGWLKRDNHGQGDFLQDPKNCKKSNGVFQALPTGSEYHDDLKFKNATQNLSNETSSISCQDLKKVVNDALREVPKSAFEVLGKPSAKTITCKRSSSEPRSSVLDCDKMSLVEQQLAADAQMHAPTHTHSISRCYCMRSSSAGRLPYHLREKYAIQLYGRTRHLPTRLKEKRYRAGPSRRQQRTVTWAADSLCSRESPHTHTKSSDCHQFPSYYIPSSSEAGSLEHVISDKGNKENDSLFSEVKHFRQAHWFDCHASPRRDSVLPEHKCVYHYVLNNRLFLEPVHSGFEKHGRCPVCLLPAPCPKLSTPPGLTRVTTPPPVTEPCALVTLPKELLNPKPETKFIPTTVTKGKVSKKKSEQSCFLTHHSKAVFKSHSHYKHADSLALRHQKGVHQVII